MIKLGYLDLDFFFFLFCFNSSINILSVYILTFLKNNLLSLCDINHLSFLLLLTKD